MRRTFTWLLLLVTTIAVAHQAARAARPTPSSGFAGTTFAVARFADIHVQNHDTGPNPWVSLQKTQGQSDLYVQTNVWAVNGTTGWHTHPGHSLIMVTAGTVTVYDGDDPECTPRTYTTGMGFVDPGGSHAHLIRNEGTVEARTVAVQLIPAGATRRLDVADPGHCGF